MRARGAQVFRLETNNHLSSSMDLIAGQRLVIRREMGEAFLTLLAQDGEVSLTIRVTPEGPVVDLRGGAVSLEVDGSLAIEAQCLVLKGKDEVVIASDGDLRVEAAGGFSSEAEVQRLEARRGNVDIRANDDVTLDGERIKMNC